MGRESMLPLNLKLEKKNCYNRRKKCQLFSKLLKKYNKYGLAGPSGSASGLYVICKQFTNFNFDLFLLACVGFFCYEPHHSIFEVLMMFPDELNESNYGSNVYDLEFCGEKVDEYQLIENIIKNI